MPRACSSVTPDNPAKSPACNAPVVKVLLCARVSVPVTPFSRVSVTRAQLLTPESLASIAVCTAAVRSQMPVTPVLRVSPVAPATVGATALSSAVRVAPLACTSVAVPEVAPTAMVTEVGEVPAWPCWSRFTVRAAGAPVGMVTVATLLVAFRENCRGTSKLSMSAVLASLLNCPLRFRLVNAVVRPVKMPAGRVANSLSRKSRLVRLASSAKRPAGTVVSWLSRKFRVVMLGRRAKSPAFSELMLSPDRFRVFPKVSKDTASQVAPPPTAVSRAVSTSSVRSQMSMARSVLPRSLRPV